MKVLFVCTGNMCRSPMAMFMLRDELKRRGVKGVEVDSAGTMKHEKPMTPLAVDTLKKHIVPVEPYLSKFVDDKIFDDADFVFVMTDEHKTMLEAWYKNGGKVKTVGEFLGHEVSDPYGLGEAAYEQTFKDLKEAMPQIADLLQSKAF